MGSGPSTVPAPGVRVRRPTWPRVARTPRPAGTRRRQGREITGVRPGDRPLQRVLLMRPNRRRLLLVAPVVALSACALEPSTRSVNDGADTAPLTGTFAVTSRFEVPATVAAPGPLGDALRLVHGLAVDPGTALLDLAEDAGVPALGELRLVLPDALESELAGWMNGYLETAAVDGVSP